MSYIAFDKSKLVNLEYSLSREVLRTNRSGAYASTTIVGCNTRKYHGLLVCPLKQFAGEKFVLLSSLDLSVIQHDKIFNLGIHKHQGDNYNPKGHKYVRDFDAEVIPRTIYRVGGVVLERAYLLVENQEQVLVKYTLLEAHSPTTLRFSPFLAFRNMHQLTHANMDANTRIQKIPNGIKSRLYDGFPYLHMQLSKPVEFIQNPEWYKDLEYLREQERGYDYKEDLFVPGYFETPIKKGESIIFSASTSPAATASLKKKFTAELNKRIPRDSFRNCLINSAQQFIVKRDGRTEVSAGYHWFGTWGRDTFIALPGLTLAIDDLKTFREVLNTMVKRIKDGLFPNMGNDKEVAYNSVDAPLWFIWAVQQLADYTGDSVTVWKEYGKYIKKILKAFREGTSFQIKMDNGGLIYAGEEGKALTWMDAVVNGRPITPRKGYAVEINALWYNSVMFALQAAGDGGDQKFVKEWKDLPEVIGASFIHSFWDDSHGYLADYWDYEYKDWSVRPNQVIATSMKYSPLDPDQKKLILDVIEKELVTPRGLRTLSPKNPQYVGVYFGDQEERDSAYHQGTVWPWLLEHYVRGYLGIHKNSGLLLVEKLYAGFQEVISEYGIGSIGEIFDGDPPHNPVGTISQAWSVSALLQISNMIDEAKAKQLNNTR